MRLILLAALATLVYGCADARNAIHPGETRILTRDWLPPEVERKQEQLYCYRTLGQQECHRVALHGEQNRMLGYYDPLPEEGAPQSLIR